MARWALSWVLLIVTATACTYWGTNALLAASGRHLGDRLAHLALDQPQGALGSPACTLAGRALVAAGAGAAPDATLDQRERWDRAAHDVIRACAQA